MWKAGATLAVAVGCGHHGMIGSDGGGDDDAVRVIDASADAPAAGFSWRMAGALVLWNDPLTVSAAALHGDHFSYVGQYAMNGCANNNPPYSCASNGCNYPGNPTPELAPSYQDLASWVQLVQQQGMYAGAWGVTYNAPEA